MLNYYYYYYYRERDAQETSDYNNKSRKINEISATHLGLPYRLIVIIRACVQFKSIPPPPTRGPSVFNYPA